MEIVEVKMEVVEVKTELFEVINYVWESSGTLHALPRKFPFLKLVQDGGSFQSRSKLKQSGSFHGYARWKLRPASLTLPHTLIYFYLPAPTFISRLELAHDFYLQGNVHRRVGSLPSTTVYSTYLHLLTSAFIHVRQRTLGLNSHLSTEGLRPTPIFKHNSRLCVRTSHAVLWNAHWLRTLYLFIFNSTSIQLKFPTLSADVYIHSCYAILHSTLFHARISACMYPTSKPTCNPCLHRNVHHRRSPMLPHTLLRRVNLDIRTRTFTYFHPLLWNFEYICSPSITVNNSSHLHL